MSNDLHLHDAPHELLIGDAIARTLAVVGLAGVALTGADDIGNWWEPLGLASLFVEAALVALAAHVLLEPSAPAVEFSRQAPVLPRSLS